MNEDLIHVCDHDITIPCLKNQVHLAKVVRIIDGDTVVLAYKDDHDSICKVVARLSGIDAPELKTDKLIALKSRNYLINLVTDIEELDLDDPRSSKELQLLLDTNTKLLLAKFDGKDKYGRELVELYFAHNSVTEFRRSINHMLLNASMAKVYQCGGRAQKIVSII